MIQNNLFYARGAPMHPSLMVIVGPGIGQSVPRGLSVDEPAPQQIGKKRRGPQPGKVRRYDDSDRALYLELEQIMNRTKESCSAAALILAESGKVAGRGTHKSSAKRLATLYQHDRRGCSRTG